MPLKRAADVVGALALGIVTLPALLSCWLLNKLTGWRAAAVYRQDRIGLEGRKFTIFKLRTMVPNAEEATGPIFSPDDDPRVTKFGRVMRRFHLDELPQLYNILRGDMSFVGPRPERPVFVEQFVEEFPRYSDRHSVKPGLTGWAQVMNRADVHNTAKKLRYDLEYVDGYSLWFDAKIAALTVWGLIAEGGRVLTGRPCGMRSEKPAEPSSSGSDAAAD